MTGPGKIERASDAEHTAVPAKPVIKQDELHAWPSVLIDGEYSIGWQGLPDKKGGPSFVTTRRAGFSGVKVVSRCPLTDEGWADAWHELMSLAPAMSEKVRTVLAQRAAEDRAIADRRQLDADSLAYLPEMVFLGGYFPGVELTPGNTYDVRFLADLLALLPRGALQAMGELMYSDVEKIDIGGPGLVKSGGGFIGGGFGVEGAAEGMAIAAILNAATTRTKIKTVVQVQAASAELFFLHTRTEPEALRIGLSRAMGAVREAQAAPANSSQRGISPGSASVVSELAKLASMLESGLLTRAEFDYLKGKLIAGFVEPLVQGQRRVNIDPGQILRRVARTLLGTADNTALIYPQLQSVDLRHQAPVTHQVRTPCRTSSGV